MRLQLTYLKNKNPAKINHSGALQAFCFLKITFISNVAPKAILNSPFWSCENTLWKVCLNKEVLKESPITM